MSRRNWRTGAAHLTISDQAGGLDGTLEMRGEKVAECDVQAGKVRSEAGGLLKTVVGER